MARKRMYRQLPRNLEENVSIMNVIFIAKIWRHKRRNKKYNTDTSRPRN
jgi:hypothetical protein